MKALTERQLGYIAAMVDGEGFICLSRDRSVVRRVPKFIPAVGISNTNRRVLEYILTTTGIGVIAPRYRSNPKAKLGFQWNLRIEEQISFLEVVKDALIIKREQADLLLEFLSLRMPGANHLTEFSEETLVMRSVIYSELADLNRKGIA